MTYDSPILQQADQNAQQAVSAPNQERMLAQFTGRRGMAPDPALAALFQQQRESAMRSMRARLAEMNARQQLHDQKMGLFYKAMDFRRLQDKWGRRDELGAMIGTGLGAGGMALGGLFSSRTPSPQTDYGPELSDLFQDDNPYGPIMNYEPAPDWFVQQRMAGRR